MLQIVFLVSSESSRGVGVHRLGFMAFEKLSRWGGAEVHRLGFITLESSGGGGVHWLGFMAFGLAVQKFL
jgi:hypothetical protein